MESIGYRRCTLTVADTAHQPTVIADAPCPLLCFTARIMQILRQTLFESPTLRIGRFEARPTSDASGDVERQNAKDRRGEKKSAGDWM